MSAVTEIYKGVETITSGDGTTGDITVGSNGDITLANCVHFATKTGNAGAVRPLRHNLILELVDDTTNIVVRWTRHESSSAVTFDLAWTVIEFDSGSIDVGVERGTHTMDTSGSTDTVNLGATYTPGVSLLFTSGTTDLLVDLDSHCEIEFSTNATYGDQLLFTARDTPGTDDHQMAYCVAELKSADVDIQHGEFSFTDNGTDTISAVTLADSIVYLTGMYSNGHSGNRYFPRIKFNSTTAVRADNSTYGTAVANNITYTVVEFLSGANVDQGTHTLADADASDNISLGSSRTRARTAAIQGYLNASNTYETGGAADHDLDDIQVKQVLDGTTTTSNLVATRAGSSLAIELGYNVVEFPAPAGGATPKGVFGLPLHGPFGGPV